MIEKETEEQRLYIMLLYPVVLPLVKGQRFSVPLCQWSPFYYTYFYAQDFPNPFSMISGLLRQYFRSNIAVFNYKYVNPRQRAEYTHVSYTLPLCISNRAEVDIGEQVEDTETGVFCISDKGQTAPVGVCVDSSRISNDISNTSSSHLRA